MVQRVSFHPSTHRVREVEKRVTIHGLWFIPGKNKFPFSAFDSIFLFGKVNRFYSGCVRQNTWRRWDEKWGRRFVIFQGNIEKREETNALTKEKKGRNDSLIHFIASLSFFSLPELTVKSCLLPLLSSFPSSRVLLFYSSDVLFLQETDRQTRKRKRRRKKKKTIKALSLSSWLSLSNVHHHQAIVPCVSEGPKSLRLDMARGGGGVMATVSIRRSCGADDVYMPYIRVVSGSQVA